MNVPHGWSSAQTQYAERSSVVILVFAWRLRSPLLAASCAASMLHWQRYSERSWRRRLDQCAALIALLRIARERRAYKLTLAPLVVYACNRRDFVAHCLFRWLCACAAAHAARLDRTCIVAMSAAHWAMVHHLV